MLREASVQDKDAIFQLAAQPKCTDDIHHRLQKAEFDVNTECDSHGDLLLHIACRTGVKQLPLVMSLVKIHGADVELGNAGGLTPLMLAAKSHNPVLCDVLVCLFGADPNKVNPHNGRCALHYAVEGNHCKTVECLIRRGADVNAEDAEGRRPDDLPLISASSNQQALHILRTNRAQRMDTLAALTRKGELEKHHIRSTDLCVVNDDGYTLIMTAAIHNRCSVLELLLQTSPSTMDAQHIKTGMTALSMASQRGNAEAVTLLLNHGANASIRDMKRYLPIHHAVINNQEKVVNVMLQYFPSCYTGLLVAARICRKTAIHVKLKSALVRRQEELVTPRLVTCAMKGDADQLYQLLEDGDDVNMQTNADGWPLYLAAENGHMAVVQLLHQHGADIRKRHSVTGETILHACARKGHSDVTQYLLGFCRPSCRQMTSSCSCPRLLDINVTDVHGHTPLQKAADHGFIRTVELLLSHGASTALLDAEGQLITCPQYHGVRMLLESHRLQHTRDVLSLISAKSKKALEQLREIWVPRFDHQLRTPEGDTPLMAACSGGQLQVVHFLLESAVYPQPSWAEGGEEDSDADSGVLAPTTEQTSPGMPAVKCSDGEESQSSGRFCQSTESPPGCTASSGDFSGPLPHRAEAVVNRTDQAASVTKMAQDSPRTHNAVHCDVRQTKALSILHDGVVSHVCATSHGDGSTALHRAVQHGNDVHVIRALLTADPACVNIQNKAGLSPLHLACQLARKKVTQVLLDTESIDLNAQSKDCLLAEEMSSNKAIIRLVQRARQQRSARDGLPLVFSDGAMRRGGPPSPARKTTSTPTSALSDSVGRRAWASSPAMKTLFSPTSLLFDRPHRHGRPLHSDVDHQVFHGT